MPYKYASETYKEALALIGKDIPTERISRILRVPSSTIRNWKLGYTRFEGYAKLDSKRKDNVLKLVDKGYNILKISKLLNLQYNTVRLFLKSSLTSLRYENVKIKAFKLPKNAKKMSPELAYIVGVMLGDGYFARYQIRLDVIDEDFRDYFADILKRWSGYKVKLRTFFNKGFGKGSKRFSCILYSKDVKDFIKNLIKEGIPKEISYAKTKKIKIMFIKGFIDSEGSMNGINSVTLSNQNLDILKQIYNFLKDMGFDMEHIKMYYYKRSKVHQMYIYTKKNMSLFYKKISFRIQRKKDRLEKAI